ncbi:MAG TPA: ankyrin repeat domain-containing protein, partial [Gemmatimonadaceae bacterium]
MDTLPLPPRPSLEQYRKRAKSLVTAVRSGDPGAVQQWAAAWLHSLGGVLDIEITPFVRGSFDRAVSQLAAAVRQRTDHSGAEAFGLADAQHVIARAHSYESWATFASEIDAIRTGSRSSTFERAADAIVSGDLETLNALLQRDPDLIRARSQRLHRVTLLHYIAANGVEDFRQKTPPNAVAVAERLIAAGADVDAIAETYGGGTYQTTMNLLVSSTHPADAGVQAELVEVLLDHGAAVDGVANDSSPILTALSFGYRDAADTLARRGATIDHVVVAAAIGRLDLVRAWVLDPVTLARAHAPYRGPSWVHIPDDAKGQIEMALAWACKFGRGEVARFLIELGVDPMATDRDQMTALHWASARGMLDVMELLLSKRADLEARNTWGGTVVDSTAWFAANAPVPDVDYPRVIDRLLAAGADVNEIYPPLTGIDAVD